MPPAGFPHSDIHGSLSAFDSPWLFADRCVLLRLSVPRHPPCALLSLTCNILSYACVQFLLESQFWVLIGKICSARLLSQARLPLFCFTFFRYLYPVFKVPLTLSGKVTQTRLRAFAAFCAFGAIRKWWAQMDSNHRPHAYQACALTT